jgi:hypothetical protein
LEFSWLSLIFFSPFKKAFLKGLLMASSLWPMWLASLEFKWTQVYLFYLFTFQWAGTSEQLSRQAIWEPPSS